MITIEKLLEKLDNGYLIEFIKREPGEDVGVIVTDITEHHKSDDGKYYEYGTCKTSNCCAEIVHSEYEDILDRDEVINSIKESLEYYYAMKIYGNNYHVEYYAKYGKNGKK